MQPSAWRNTRTHTHTHPHLLPFNYEIMSKTLSKNEWQLAQIPLRPLKQGKTLRTFNCLQFLASLAVCVCVFG